MVKVVEAFAYAASAPRYVALAYGALGAIWIVGSDHVLALLVADAGALSLLQTYKGWVFIGVTAVLLYFLVRRLLLRITAAQEELARSHEELLAAHEQLKANQARLIQTEKLASLGQLAAGVAHEISNPITFLKTNISTLRDYAGVVESVLDTCACLQDGPPEGLSCPRHADHAALAMVMRRQEVSYVRSDVSELVAECTEGIRRIEQIATDLRTYSHPGNGQFEQTDVNRVLESSLRIAWNELKYKAKVGKDLGELPLIQADPLRLSQVFVNLLVNAAQAIPKRGDVYITTRAEEESVLVEIADTGTGIAPEHLPHMFDPFFTTKQVGVGTGLGLSITHAILKQHHAVVKVDSQPQRGTKFTIRLPLVPPQSNGQAPVAVTAAA